MPLCGVAAAPTRARVHSTVGVYCAMITGTVRGNATDELHGLSQHLSVTSIRLKPCPTVGGADPE